MQKVDNTCQRRESSTSGCRPWPKTSVLRLSTVMNKDSYTSLLLFISIFLFSLGIEPAMNWVLEHMGDPGIVL